jgi:hypothetical protein
MVLGQRRGTGTAFPGAARRSDQALETQPMDLESRRRWEDYSKAKDEMFAYTDTKQSPWYVVNSNDKRRAHLNCISHLLSVISYQDLTPPPMELPPRQETSGYVRPPMEYQTFVPEIY